MQLSQAPSKACTKTTKLALLGVAPTFPGMCQDYPATGTTGAAPCAGGQLGVERWPHELPLAVRR